MEFRSLAKSIARLALAVAPLFLAHAVVGAEPASPAILLNAGSEHPAAEVARAHELAQRVTIYRDAWGTPHIDGDNDEALLFGFAYAQAEDNFWQIEDSYILGLGRYCEVHGPKGLNSDLLNRAFEIVPSAQADYQQLEPKHKRACEAFSYGLNHYLRKHAETKPRLIRHFEPWQLLAFGRHLLMELSFRCSGLSETYMPRSQDLVWAEAGSNAWAIAPSKTRDGKALLLVNPHMPWFGFGQMYEVHLRSGDGWTFTGCTMYGSPMMSMGHNEHLGWAYTTNEPDIADVWRVTFDDPQRPLNYRYGDGYRAASERLETIRVKTAEGYNDRVYKLRGTHYGPVVVCENDRHFLAVRISGLRNTMMFSQTMRMIRSRNINEFKAALSMQQTPLMNIVYADRGGNIFYIYNGVIPRRSSQFDWRKPVDGADPATEWQGVLRVDELPQVLNPACGYVQNCNSSPFTTCEENPQREAFAPYLARDADDDKRRARRSREMLREMHDVTFEDLQTAAFDTKVQWASEQLPRYAARFKLLKQSDPALAAQVEPYFSHLLDWDCRVTLDSTAATLCAAWYEELYGAGYPAEKLRPKFAEQPQLEFQALADAAYKLLSIHGAWQVKWGDVFRLQRRPCVADVLELPFSDALPSLPSVGAPGSMGVIFTQYYTPVLRIPFIREIKQRYGLIGATYLAVYEFGDKVRGATTMNFGQSGDPKSPHFSDQCEKLLTAGQLKRELFDWEDVLAAAQQIYHPGETPVKAARR